MLVIRLSRVGRSKKYFYRIVLQDKRTGVKNKAIETFGSYAPASPQKPLILNKERISYWLTKGAAPSDSVAVLLKKQGFPQMEKFIEPRNRKHKKKSEEPVEEKAKGADKASEAPTEKAPPLKPA